LERIDAVVGEVTHTLPRLVRSAHAREVDYGTVVSGTEVVVSGTEVVVSGTEVVVSGTEVVVSGSDVLVSGSDVLVSGSDVVVPGAMVLVVVRGSRLPASAQVCRSVKVSVSPARR
jgi:hypothetical protein